MKCPICGAKMHRVISTFDLGAIVGLPSVVVNNMRALACDDPDHPAYFEGRDIQTIMKRLAVTMIRTVDILGGSEVRFLRKHLKEPAARFAERVGVTVETLTAWEDANTELDAPTSYAIRHLVALLLGKREKIRFKLEPVAARLGHGRQDAYHLDLKSRAA